MQIPFIDLQRNYQKRKTAIDQAIQRVCEKGVYILGEEVRKFEEEFAAYLHVKHAIGVASGTDALVITLKVLGIGKGDEVIMPANSYPTVFAVMQAGATPKLVDIDPDTYTLDPTKIEASITPATKAILPVHLYGTPAEMSLILALATKYNLFVVEDAAQAHGALYKGKKIGTLGTLGCFSFYPTKNLGCLGDGGMIVTNNAKLARICREFRMYGEKGRYQSVRLGTNSRLDELQAAILRVKLLYLDRENIKRQQIAKNYRNILTSTSYILPPESKTHSSVYHLFVIRTQKRNALQKFLLQHKIHTAIHFPIPIHLVKSFSYLGYKKGDFPITEKAAKQILSLPCYPDLTEKEQQKISHLCKKFHT